MSVIRERIGPRQYRFVYVAYPDCPLRPCFWVREHMIRSDAGYSGCSSRSSGQYVCGMNDMRGCPKPLPPPASPGEARWQRGRAGAWEEKSR